MTTNTLPRGRVWRMPDLDVSTAWEVAFIPGGWGFQVRGLHPLAAMAASGVRGTQSEAFAACEEAMRRWCP